METFLGMQEIAGRTTWKVIHLYLDNYITVSYSERLWTSTRYIWQNHFALRASQSSLGPELSLLTYDDLILPDVRKQYCSSFVTKLQFATSWLH